MKQSKFFIVNRAKFELLSGADVITEYTFNTGQARHTFCSVCGVQPFYTPRSNAQAGICELRCMPSYCM